MPGKRMGRRTNKYGNRKGCAFGVAFDSRLEASRALFLASALRDGRIRNLRRQVEYELIPRQTEHVVEHLKTKDRTRERVVERPCRYVADFVYERRGEDGAWTEVVEDTKSPVTRTGEYVIKRKLMLWRHGIRIREIMKAAEDV